MAYGVNAPFGFVPYSHLLGSGLPIQRRPYLLQASTDGLTTYVHSLFKGDPVFWNGVAANGGGGTISNYQDIIADTQPIGVFDGVEYYDVNNVLQKRPCWIGATPIYPGTQIKCWVMDDPYVIWNIQYSTSTNVLADARMLPAFKGQNTKFNVGGGGNNINNPATGNTRTGISVYYADDDVADGAVASLTLKILDYIPDPTNYIYQTNGITVREFLNIQVIFNAHAYKNLGTKGNVAA